MNVIMGDRIMAVDTYEVRQFSMVELQRRHTEAVQAGLKVVAGVIKHEMERRANR